MTAEPPPFPPMDERPETIADLLALAVQWLDAADARLGVPADERALQVDLAAVADWLRARPVLDAEIYHAVEAAEPDEVGG